MTHKEFERIAMLWKMPLDELRRQATDAEFKPTVADARACTRGMDRAALVDRAYELIYGFDDED